jgi:hypothetical protein
MAEVLVEFSTMVTAPDGRRFVPSVCGRQSEHVWEGWVEFVAEDGAGAPLRTGRETVQSTRDDLMYWAQGLTQIFLEGALARAIGGTARAARVERDVPRPAHFDGPASSSSDATGGASLRPRPVLDPFATFAQGRDVLRQELDALDTERVRDIALAYGFAEPGWTDAASRDDLVATILRGVQHAGGTAETAERPRAEPPA